MSLNPLEQINLITMGAVVVIFFATFFLLRRICFVPVIRVMEQRAARIDAARARKGEADQLLENARHEAAAALAAAKAEGDRTAEQSRGEAEKQRRDELAKASAEAATILATGRTELLALRKEEEAALRAELHSCVGQTLERMLGKVDDAAVRLMVSRVLDESGAR